MACCARLQEKGMFSQKAVSRSAQETMATDPSMMVDMMKKNLTGMVPQVGQWPPYLAGGFSQYFWPV
jgi:hypothetical protein